jgi:hypothetical protein
MISNAVAVELLIENCGFEPRVALGIAEAIETSMTQAQIITTPILDARVAQLEAKIDTRAAQLEAKIDTQVARLEVKIESVKAELVRWVFVAMLGNAVLSTIAAALLNAFEHSR